MELYIHPLYTPDKDSFCIYCGEKFTETFIATKEHLIPRSKGGGKYVNNVKNACYDCNALKGDMLPEKFLEFVKTQYIGLPKENISLSIQYRYDIFIENIQYVVEYVAWLFSLPKNFKMKKTLKEKLRRQKKAEKIRLQKLFQESFADSE